MSQNTIDNPAQNTRNITNINKRTYKNLFLLHGKTEAITSCGGKLSLLYFDWGASLEEEIPGCSCLVSATKASRVSELTASNVL